MEPNEEAVAKMLTEISTKGMEKPPSIEDVYYRPDYQDYQIIINGHFHCEVREKLFKDYVEHKHKDTIREIIYLLDNPMEFEDWEDGPGGGAEAPADDEKMVIDDSDKYDF